MFNLFKAVKELFSSKSNNKKNIIVGDKKTKKDEEVKYSIKEIEENYKNDSVRTSQEVKPEIVQKHFLKLNKNIKSLTRIYQTKIKSKSRLSIEPNNTSESQIIPFEQRKTISYPSKNGLYVPEILMLHFCKRYPMAEGSKPYLYWWNSYGVKDVEGMAKSLMERGFLEIDDKTQKYKPTELGKKELQENEYVPYMHKNAKHTCFTVWDLNKKLATNDKSNFMDIINRYNAKRDRIRKFLEIRERFCMVELKKNNPESYKSLKEMTNKLKKQDIQLNIIKKADEEYKETKDLNTYIRFWEDIWENGGINFESNSWMFKLPDLYIKAKRYDDAFKIVELIKNTKSSYYHTKVEKYIDKIEERKAKLEERKTKQLTKTK